MSTPTEDDLETIPDGELLSLPSGSIPPGWLSEFFGRRAALIHQQDTDELALDLPQYGPEGETPARGRSPPPRLAGRSGNAGIPRALRPPAGTDRATAARCRETPEGDRGQRA